MDKIAITRHPRHVKSIILQNFVFTVVLHEGNKIIQ
jgi:hypothetical protein